VLLRLGERGKLGKVGVSVDVGVWILENFFSVIEWFFQDTGEVESDV
jgi:hypothetical protein